MFLRNLFRVAAIFVLLILCMVVIFAGPMLNIAGILPIGWAMLLLFCTITLGITTAITYGGRIVDWIVKKTGN